MRETVNINNLTLCHKHSDGYTKSTLPDMCRTPVEPVPYTNVAYARDLADGTTTVLSHGGAMNGVKGSEFAISFGDEPGVGKGIVSNTVQAEATWLSWSPNVFMEKRAVTRLTDKMWMNHANTVSIGGYQTNYLAERIICKIGCYCYVLHFGLSLAGKGLDALQRPAGGETKRYSKCFKDFVDEQYPSVKFGNPGSGTGLVSEHSFVGASGSRRFMDAIWMQNGTPTNMYDLKFGSDVSNTGAKAADYQHFANQNGGASYREFRIPDECDGCGDEVDEKNRQWAKNFGSVLHGVGTGLLGGVTGGRGGFRPAIP